MCHDAEPSWHSEDLAENSQNGEVDEWDSSPYHTGHCIVAKLAVAAVAWEQYLTLPHLFRVECSESYQIPSRVLVNS